MNRRFRCIVMKIALPRSHCPSRIESESSPGPYDVQPANRKIATTPTRARIETFIFIMFSNYGEIRWGNPGKSGDSIPIYCLCFLSLFIESRLNMYTVPGFAVGFEVLCKLTSTYRVTPFQLLSNKGVILISVPFEAVPG